eukprot:scaffold16595_cov174-Skeletonema_dohrnii-CCMP3373.AAC.2
MSSRALRRLRVEQEASLAEEHDGDESSSDEEQNDGGGGGFMAMLEEESSSEEESSESDDEEEEDEEDQPAVAASNKSKKGQATAKKEQAPVEEEEDLDAILSDMKIQNEITGDEAENNDPSASTNSSTVRSILLSKTHGYDTQDLDLDYSLRDLLGGAAVAGNPLFIDDDDIQQQQQLQQQRGRNNRNRGGRNNRRTVAKKYLFGKVKPEWGKPPSFVGGGLGVKELTQDVLEEEEGNKWSVPWPYNESGDGCGEDDDENKEKDAFPNAKWFTFDMSDTYSEINRKYEQMLSNPQAGMQDPNLLAMFVADNPFFAETILQMAMVLYYVNDRGRGSDLLRRCMYLYETALPSSLLPSNTNANDGEANNEIFMDINLQPNSGFFACLFRIMQTSGMSGCHPNALAVGRYLLSLDPLRDPMGVLLILDYYALASRRASVALSEEDEDGLELGASFIVDLVESEKITINWEDDLTSRHHKCPLLQLPNWAFSYAMALHRLSRKEEADEALKTALETFPMVLPKLLEMNKVNVQARSFQMDWPTVLPAFNHDLNTANIDEVNTQIEARVARAAGEHLVRIFVERNHKLWKENDVVQWMYSCSEKVVKGDEPQLEKEADAGEGAMSTSTELPPKQLTSKFSPALVRYAQCDPSDYEDRFRTFPPEAIALDPNLVGPALVHDHRRGRFLRGGQARGGGGMMEREMMEDVPADLMEQLRGMLGMAGNEVDLLDPDSPILQLYLQSLLPWAQVEGVRPPR